MKRGSLLKHLRKHGCFLKREGKEHSLWSNPQTGATEAVPHGSIESFGEEDLPKFIYTDTIIK